jgi:hypothetical protein
LKSEPNMITYAQRKCEYFDILIRLPMQHAGRAKLLGTFARARVFDVSAPNCPIQSCQIEIAPGRTTTTLGQPRGIPDRHLETFELVAQYLQSQSQMELVKGHHYPLSVPAGYPLV